MSRTKVSLQRQWIDLQTGDTLTLCQAAGHRLQLSAAREAASPQHPARVWLTEEGMPDDVFLHPGDAYRVRGAGRVVLTAWSGCVRLMLAASTEPAPPRQATALRSRSIQSASTWATACGASAMRL